MADHSVDRYYQKIQSFPVSLGFLNRCLWAPQIAGEQGLSESVWLYHWVCSVPSPTCPQQMPGYGFHPRFSLRCGDLAVVIGLRLAKILFSTQNLKWNEGDKLFRSRFPRGGWPAQGPQGNLSVLGNMALVEAEKRESILPCWPWS